MMEALLPDIPPAQLPRTWAEYERIPEPEEDRLVGKAVYSGSAGRRVTIAKRTGGTWAVTLSLADRNPFGVEAGTEIAETAASKRPIAVATAIGFMSQSRRLEQAFF